jgi:HAD superfamily hydrolase (TIGR01490 family)
MQAAVFCDIEGTLISGQVGRIVYDTARAHKLFTPIQVAQIITMALSARLLPREQRIRLLAFSTTRFVAGWDDSQVQKLLNVAIPALTARLKPHTLERLRQHQQDGLPLVLMTGVIQPVANGIARSLGGQAEGTYLRKRNGRYTGQFDGKLCNGEAKGERVREVMTRQGCHPAACYAYGDTAADIPFLASCGHPCAVDPDLELEAEAIRRGWPILR